MEEATDYPFFYGQYSDIGAWYAADTATTHTIKVMRPTVKYTPIDANFMPEGYPKKSVETATLMEEQEVTFSDMGGGVYGAAAPVILDVKLGDKLTVVWDGVSYDVEVRRIAPGPDVVFLIFGNLGLAGLEGATDQPFLYTDQVYGDNTWYTADTATTHTIKVIGEKETYKTIDKNFLPKYVSYEVQDLTDEEKTIARNNVNALSKDVLVEIPTNIVLASDFERYYEKHKETGLPIKWDGKNITYIEYLGSTDGIKSYVLSIGRLLVKI